MCLQKPFCTERISTCKLCTHIRIGCLPLYPSILLSLSFSLFPSPSATISPCGWVRTKFFPLCSAKMFAFHLLCTRALRFAQQSHSLTLSHTLAHSHTRWLSLSLIGRPSLGTVTSLTFAMDHIQLNGALELLSKMLDSWDSNPENCSRIN